MGGGAGLVCNAHFNLATDDTLFAMPECGIGFFPDVGASWWLTRKTFARTGLYNREFRRALSAPIPEFCCTWPSACNITRYRCDAVL